LIRDLRSAGKDDRKIEIDNRAAAEGDSNSHGHYTGTVCAHSKGKRQARRSESIQWRI
jgi:hypothetical protein